MDDKTEKKSLIPKMTNFGKWLVLILLAFILIWPLSAGLYWTVYRAYTLVDPTRFRDLDANVEALLKSTTPESEAPRKGAALLASIRNRLEQEMDSTFGWSINDLIISPTRWLDNRANRQRGSIFATRMMTTFFSTNLAKYGKVDKENENLKEAREKYFAFTSDSWWFPSSENQYEKGIAELKQYEADLLKSDSGAIYNLRTDDMYNMLEFIIGKQFLDEPLGLLVQSNDQVPYTELDDHIYYTQGIILVLRDALRTFVHLYPEVQEKGGKENISIAFKEMDQICSFDPLIVLRGDHDSIMADHRGKVARYLISIRERINDLAQSIKS
ncbi:hypothetical protein JY97_05165 [Alkalispirochaeta odontotermitis]|nr:hypothetical protein JY97_05165 [Alkalispirochaeta odontotermitis]CAB1083301.1 hypothetical protein D1AOALGA4SA_10875 [Olavius algarvensis Delta 1 endosymbiont]